MPVGECRGLARRLRTGAALVIATALAGCPILPAKYQTEAAKTLAVGTRAVLHGAFREYLVWYWQVTITAVDGQTVTTPLKTASRVELEPGEHRVAILFEVLTIGQTEPVACTFRQAFEGGHDYHVLRLENAVTRSGPTVLVLSDRASGEATRELRLPCQ